MNIVGTSWACVIRWRSISSSIASGSNRSMRTTVPPSRCTAIVQWIGAVWYSGAGFR